MIIERPDYTIIVKDSPFKEFNDLQKMAINEGWTKAITDENDRYFIVVVMEGVPCFSFTSVGIGDRILRIVTKLYSNPDKRNTLGKTLWKNIIYDCIAIFDLPEFSHIKLKLITRHPSLSNWKTIYRKLEWTIDEDSLYLIGRNRQKQTAWKQIYYKGDISELDRPKMTMEKYKAFFGEYYFNYDWSKPAIENTRSILSNPQKCLEIGAFEGRFAIWLAETYKCEVTTIDPFDGSVYGIAQEIFKEAYPNCINNISKCKQKIELIHKTSFEALIELNQSKAEYDFIYIDGSHRSAEVLEDLVLAYRLLKKNGVLLLDDSVYWKARNHITNEYIQDVTESPRMAVDSFIHIHWKDLEVLRLPNNYQTAFKKL